MKLDAESKKVRPPGESTLYRIRSAASARNGQALLWSTITGCLIFLSFPDYDLFPLQWFSLVPLLHVMSDRRPKGAFGWGFWAGLVTNWGGFYWITSMLMDFGHFSLGVAIPVCTLMCAYQGLAIAFWATLTRAVVIHTGASLLWVGPVVWVSVETVMPFIFPWFMGNGQYLFYSSIQVAELTGVTGVTFVVVLVNCSLYVGGHALLNKRTRAGTQALAIGAAVFFANVLYGVVRISSLDAEQAAASKLRIGLGEADVGIFEKEAKALRNVNERLWMLRGNVMKHHLLAAELESRDHVDLIVLPESSFIPVPPPYSTLRFKRSDTFAVAATADASLWALEGDTWRAMGKSPDGRQVLGIGSAGDHAIVAVGAKGLALLADGRDWRLEESGTTETLRGVWAGEAVSEYARIDGLPWFALAVGDAGAAVIREDGRWRALDTDVNATLVAIDAEDAQVAWAVGERGIVLAWNGTTWKREEPGTSVNLYDVKVVGEGEAWAVGAQGVVLHRQAGVWTKENLTAGSLRSIDGLRGRFLTAGDDGALFERTKDAWQPRTPVAGARPRHVVIDGRGRAIVGGAAGQIIEQAKPQVPWVLSPPLGQRSDVVALATVPFSEAHAYPRDSKWVGRSSTPLPVVPGGITLNVAEVQSRVLPEDKRTPADEWNVPIRGFDTPVLLGLLTYDSVPGQIPMSDRDSRKTYNSAMLLDGDGKVLGRYDKNYLLIFGEYIPFGEQFPSLYEALPEASHFYAGETVEAFPFKGHRLGVMICYEDILPRFTRRLADQDPNVLINVTNDAWFGQTSEPYHHLALAVFRAVENRLWLVRSTNTGVSAFVDAVGRIVGQTKLTDPEVLVADVPMLTSTTLYRRAGDWFGILNTAVFLFAFARALLNRRRSRIHGQTR